ncbi:TolC family protein [Oculatella sp. FACHB-28]|uniref:TolC family protein n=1 Tax=Oculatella sp. FACHB-28 TaxID=2692845 RepID=UPI001689E735|nr:TolC family protein [Oculatella sp. FACHB-28]MBD2059153.1 TolC family protein [Oculatella sp. FACHB-28]
MRFSTFVFCTLTLIAAQAITRRAIATPAPALEETKESPVSVANDAKPELSPVTTPPEVEPVKPFAHREVAHSVTGDRPTSAPTAPEPDAKVEIALPTPEPELEPEPIGSVEIAAVSPEWTAVAPQNSVEWSRPNFAPFEPALEEQNLQVPTPEEPIVVPVVVPENEPVQLPDVESDQVESEVAPQMEPDAAPEGEPAQLPNAEPGIEVDAESGIEIEVQAPPDPASLNTLEEFAPPPNPLTRPTFPEEVEVGEAVPITLEQAIALAQRHNLDLQTAQLELERTEAELREAQAANLPRLTAGADLTLQQSQSSSGLPEELEAALGIESGNNSSTAAVLGGSVELNYDIFTSGRRSAQISAGERRVRLQQLQVEVTSEATVLDVVNDYYDLQEADEQVRIARASLAETESSLRDATALEQAGIGTRFEQLQAQVDVANAQQDLVEALSQQEVSRRQLRQRLGIAESVNVAAADPVRVAGDWLPNLEESIVLAYQNRAELEQQLVQREISQQQRRAALSELGPQVSAFASYGVQDTLNQEGGLDDTYQLGLRMNMNLFDGGATRARAAQEEANVAIAETQFANVRNQVRLEVEQAYFTLQSSFENTRTATQAVDFATEALRLARLRYRAGVGTQTEVLQAQSDLTQAEVNLLQAILGYNRSLASLQRAVGSFSEV